MLPKFLTVCSPPPIFTGKIKKKILKMLQKASIQHLTKELLNTSYFSLVNKQTIQGDFCLRSILNILFDLDLTKTSVITFVLGPWVTSGASLSVRSNFFRISSRSKIPSTAAPKFFSSSSIKLTTRSSGLCTITLETKAQDCVLLNKTYPTYIKTIVN